LLRRNATGEACIDRIATTRVWGESPLLGVGLLTAAVLEKSFDSAQEGLTDGFRIRQAAGGHGAVPQHDEVPGGGFRIGFSGVGEELGDRVQKPLPMPEDCLMDRMGRVGVLGGGVEERAAPEARALDVVGNGSADSSNDVVGGSVLGPCGIRP